MLKQIIQSAMTGFGDCVIGFVSAYLLKKQLEKQYSHPEITLLIKWNGVNCPMIKKEYTYTGYVNRRSKAHMNCLYSGNDGTLAFNNYYNSPIMSHILRHKTHLFITINQYVGRCFINNDTSRDEIKQLTYEAYQYFWNQMVDHMEIPPIVNSNEIPYDQLTVVYVRLGDQYLCDGKTDYQDVLKQQYKHISSITTQPNITLIGDVSNQKMIDVYQEMYGTHQQLIMLSGNVAHSCGQLSTDEWNKIWCDLYLLLKAKQVIILTNYSNFVRIVMPLKNMEKQEIYWLVDDQLKQITDNSLVFAKHYIF